MFALAACSDSGGDTAVFPSDDIEGLVVERVGAYVHVLVAVDYPRPAPSGGDHLFGATWLTCGVYTEPVPDEYAVHSLEHGAVWIAIGADAPAGSADQAAELAGEYRKVVVSPVPDLPSPVELVAWEHRLPLDSLDDPRVEEFMDRFIDGSSSPEQGSACEGAVGVPPDAPELQLP